MRGLKSILSIVLFLAVNQVYSQFYNGMQMDFGKNRIQYSGYLWSHYKYEKFDVYFYEQGKNLADYVSRSAHLQVQEFESQFDHQLKTKIQFVVYNTQSQSRESNIGNYANESGNTGGAARTLDNKVFLYFTGDHEDLDRQIRSGVAKILIQEIVYGDDYKEVLKNSAMLSFPDWFIDGLVSYLSEKWSIDIESRVNEAFKSGQFDNFGHLQGSEAVLAGHSLWFYIADNFGENSINNVLYMAKVNRSIENGFLFVLGKGMNNLLIDWKYYFEDRIKKDEASRFSPIGKDLLEKYKKGRVFNRLQFNNGSSWAAYTTHESSQLKVWVFNTQTGKAKRIFKKGHKIDIETDHSFPVLAWHPNGNELSVFYEHKGELKWLIYDVTTADEKLEKITFLEKILDASYSHDGHKIALSAVREGKTDIYVYDVRARASEQVTDDYFDDRHPAFMNNSQDIIFASNRTNDTMGAVGELNKVYAKKSDLFIYSYSKKVPYRISNQVLRRVTSTPLINETQPYSIGAGEIIYLSDANGRVNQWYAKLDSTVAFVDTAVHYRYVSSHKTLTNYKKSIQWHHVNYNNSIGLVYRDGRKSAVKFHLYSDIMNNDWNLENTNFKKRLGVGDSIDAPVQKSKVVFTLDSIRNRVAKDSNYVYTDFYLFSNELKSDVDSVIKVEVDPVSNVFSPLSFGEFPTSDSVATKVKMRNYELVFRTKEAGVQLDNRFLNMQYQRFTGGANYPNPGMNGFTKFAVEDLLEDYTIVGAFRIGDLYSNEVFISLFDRKKRLDKQYLLYRNTHLDLSDEIFNKNVTYEGLYRLTYPLSMVDRLTATFSLRYDQFLPLSVNKTLIAQDVEHEFWPNVRLDYTFDNTRSLGLNLFSGLRMKFFTEFYQEAPEWGNRILTFGGDIRHYTKIHRNLIWANRIAGGSSAGSQRLIYYMGGVDSWLSPKFNSELEPGELKDGQSYAFQTLATNLRGFKQNVRNGTSFMAINSEIRWPIVNYLMKRPVNSSLLNNFQLLFFGDVGTAWTGISPFSENNSLNEKNIPIGGEANTGTINLKTQKEPIVGGYGFGARSKLWGYFIRLDWAWGIEDGVNQGRTFYMSLTTDF